MLLELVYRGGIGLDGINFRRAGGSEILGVCDRLAMGMDSLSITRHLLPLV
jgi:hypothetical protein